MADDSESRSPSYLAAEARARVSIDEQLAAAGWVVQDRRDLNLRAGLGVAVREFVMREGHGRADYLLFVDREPVGWLDQTIDDRTLDQMRAGRSRHVELRSRLFGTQECATIDTEGGGDNPSSGHRRRRPRSRILSRLVDSAPWRSGWHGRRLS